MDELVRAGSYVGIKLPSDVLKVVEIQPNTSVSLGKFGSFQANHLIGRPYHLTYEILDSPAEHGGSPLRIVSADELHEIALGDASASGGAANGTDGLDIEIVNADGKVVMQTNQFIFDDSVSQKLTVDEIEALKKADTSSGKDIVAKILESHSALDKKTVFSLAKYTLRKTKKYVKRFSAVPVDIPLLMTWLIDDRDAPRIMEMRLETLSLMTSWSNAHWMGAMPQNEEIGLYHDHNRWLAVDEVSGLLVAALAERMGILYPKPGNNVLNDLDTNGEIGHTVDTNGRTISNSHLEQTVSTDVKPQKNAAKLKQEARIHTQELAMSNTTNTITLVHQNVQPNLSLLTYFGYNVSNPDTDHPLYTNLKEISFLQLLRPDEDYAYMEPPIATDEELKAMKSRQKSTYYRKRRRWQRTKAVVEETRAGGFAGLVVASFMTSTSVLNSLVQLLRGGAQVVVYSPSIEPLTELLDCYSKARRAAFISAESPSFPSEEFPVDPRLLIGVSIHTARSRPWQVLPGRTHPKMTGRGGAEGYIFVGTKVQPLEGKIEGRGAYKRRKLDAGSSGAQTPQKNVASQSED